ncbi:hypothetical protein PHMEG_00037997, partial [Phytophthora megakarya]
MCAGYKHYDALLDIATHGANVSLSSPLPRQSMPPANHKSAHDRYSILVGNVRKEQDTWRCIVLDADILEIWKEVHISPFRVVDKRELGPSSGRTIHDLSFPVGHSLNDYTNTSVICSPTFERCDAIAVEILRLQEAHPDTEIKQRAGDVATAFRNVCIQSRRAFLFGGWLERDNALVIDTSAAFGWSGSPATYDIVGGAIAYVHGNSTTNQQPDGMFNYYSVDDHINVAADIGSNCNDAEQSLRLAMTTILGPTAVNEDKFTSWKTRQKALGLIFDTVAGTVSMPAAQITKAAACVNAAYRATLLSRTDYRSLLGRLRHVATCVRLARAFLQRLRQQERHLHHRWGRQEISWWVIILRSPLLNGVPIDYFHSNPAPDVCVEMDASDSVQCALVAEDRRILRYAFSEVERGLILSTNTDPTVGFDMNYRELLSC